MVTEVTGCVDTIKLSLAFPEHERAGEADMLACVEIMLFPWCADEARTPLHPGLLNALDEWHAHQQAKEEQQILLKEQNQLLKFIGNI